MWPDNRIARDAHYLYRYDRHGRLTEKTDLIPEGVIRTDDERTHRYHYDSRHRLVHYTRTQYAEPLVESRYLYDPLGRRVAKRVWRRERDLTGWMSLSRKPEVTVRLGRRPADHDTERQNPHPDGLSAGELHATHQS
ncbi:hypothetical protein ECZU26_29120 [Escherichia coli]|nr:hypothetical protein ECZU26_29120 [Escherichia coli]